MWLVTRQAGGKRWQAGGKPGKDRQLSEDYPSRLPNMRQDLPIHCGAFESAQVRQGVASGCPCGTALSRSLLVRETLLTLMRYRADE